MTERRTARTVHKEAAQWAARADRGDLTSAETQALDAWLAADPRHRGAYARAAAIWSTLDRAKALAAPVHLKVARSRRGWGLAAGAAALAAVAAAALVSVQVFPRSSAAYETVVGEVKHVALADGSSADINTNSALSISMTPRARAVALERGEAWFKVAKNPSRPFIVSAGDIRVRAVGTAFAVRRMSGGAEVHITEGVVEIWSTAAPGVRTRAPAGGRLYVPASGEGPRSLAGRGGVDEGLAWRQGRLALEGMSVAEAAVEFNRYNKRRIVVADPALGRKGLVGWFRTNQPEHFAEVVGQTFGAPVTTDATTIRLGAPPHER
ncbi:FecR domain-containing protein [Caulobacter sp.]|uniref:FecR family protein n=1 Tax=Caulobacter sp. TaxID=78 RepID=UPI001B0245D7|nr:FecR domain-containing protein [Caulobacter sp.]MBO9546365.1 FecR domain-containing protein [Caulobacter sp.]